MKRRELLEKSVALGFMVAAPALAGEGFAGDSRAARVTVAGRSQSAPALSPLTPPKSGTIAVAYPLLPVSSRLTLPGLGAFSAP